MARRVLASRVDKARRKEQDSFHGLKISVPSHREC
jgi:hypothetical protein